jgi:hypothetical protein
VTTFLQANDIIDWHLALPAGDFSKVMMIVEVDDDTVWLTDGYSMFGYVLGQTTLGELRPVTESEAEVHRARISRVWERYSRGGSQGPFARSQPSAV